MRQNKTVPLSVVLALFFLTGITGLVYEVVWTRALSLVFGVGVVAATAVLSSYMAGMAIGSWLLGRYSDGIRRPLCWYGALEAGIALCAILLPMAIQRVQDFYVGLHGGVENSPAIVGVIRFALSLLILLVPASLMGGTLPLLASGFKSHMGRTTGWLYAANTLGAVLGCFASGFYLIGFVGMQRLTLAAVACNLVVAGIAGALGWLSGPVTPAKRAQETPKDLQWLFWAWGLSGLAALSYEILWMRVLVFYLWGSVYAFSAMLTTFLAGLGLGSLIAGRTADRTSKPESWFGLLQASVGLTACLTLPVFSYVFPWLKQVWPEFANVVWGSPSYLKFLKCFLVMIVPTLLMGASFPLAVRCYVRDPMKVGYHVGKLYAFNTFGCMLGAAMATFILLPLVGTHRALILTSLLNAAGALLAWRHMSRESGHHKILLGILACQLILGLLLFPQKVILKSEEEGNNVLYYRDGATATVKVWEASDGKERHLSINGYPVAGVGKSYAEVQKMLAHLPCLLQEPGPESVLIVGFGTGGTCYGVTLYDPPWAECSELVPGVPLAAPYFADGVNHNVLLNPNFHLVLEDGRNRVLTTKRQYDVITVDATSPKHAGNGSLYAREFYEDCRLKLTPKGILAQWLPFHLLTEEEVKIILESMRQVFPYTTVWLTSRQWYATALGTLEPLVIDYGKLADKMARDKIARELVDLDVLTPDDLLNCFVMDGEGLKQYCSGSVINSDDQPIIEYYLGTTLWGLFPFPARIGQVPVVNVPPANQERLRQTLQLSAASIEARYILAHGDVPRASFMVEKILQTDPSDKIALQIRQEIQEYLAEMGAIPPDPVSSPTGP